MVLRYTREQVLERLAEQTQAGKSLLMFGAGIGLTAKCAELGGADLIGVYSTARYRMMGKPSLLAWLPYSDANRIVREMAPEILSAVKKTPCIAGIGAHDPGIDLDRILDDIMALGFSGITNEPFAGIYGLEFGQELEAAGIGFSREVQLINKARQKNIFTVAWAFTPEEARIMTQAGADVIGAIVGVTTGGLTGAARALTLEEATKEIRAMCAAAKEINPSIFVLTHGGPFNDVATAEYSVANSDAVGYAAGSSGERLPVEQAIISITRQYKEIKLKA